MPAVSLPRPPETLGPAGHSAHESAPGVGAVRPGEPQAHRRVWPGSLGTRHLPPEPRSSCLHRGGDLGDAVEARLQGISYQWGGPLGHGSRDRWVSGAGVSAQLPPQHPAYLSHNTPSPLGPLPKAGSERTWRGGRDSSQHGPRSRGRGHERADRPRDRPREGRQAAARGPPRPPTSASSVQRCQHRVPDDKTSRCRVRTGSSV